MFSTDSINLAGVDVTDHHAIDREIRAERVETALGMSKYLVATSVFTQILTLFIWLNNQQYVQFPLFALVLIFPVVTWGVFPYLYRRGYGEQGLFVATLASFPVIFAGPLLVVEFLPVFIFAYSLVALMASLFLGSRRSLWIGMLCVVGFTCDVILIHTVSTNWFIPLEASIGLVATIVLSFIACTLNVYIARAIVLSQELQFRQSRIAYREVERRVEIETEQRQLLEHSRQEIERQASVEQEQRQYLEGLLNQIREVTDVLKNAVMEIQAAATQQLNSATEQDAAVTQTVATVEEVRNTVSQTSERARIVADTSQQTVSVSHQGQNAIRDTIDGMHTIRQRVDDIAQTILMLSERTQQIGQIIDVVNALADQSKLLALNASIEAARVGEEGKGFAVVAMEVRQLAEESRQATAQVETILSEIQQATNTAVMVTEQGSKEAEKGVALVERAGSAIRELTAALETAAQAATQIAASTHQQTNGMDQLAAAMAQFQQVSAQTTASSKQTEDSIRNILETARQLELSASSRTSLA